MRLRRTRLSTLDLDMRNVIFYRSQKKISSQNVFYSFLNIFVEIDCCLYGLDLNSSAARIDLNSCSQIDFLVSRIKRKAYERKILFEIKSLWNETNLEPIEYRNFFSIF